MITDVKSKLRGGNPVVAGWLTTASPLVAEAMASCGFGVLVVDMEHGPIDEAAALVAFAAAERRGAAPLVRLPSADPYLARRLLDGGALGLIVPCVEDAGAFADFVSHCRYPPKGRRGTGLGRGNLWGDSFASHFNDFEPVILAMIETRKGVTAAGAIAAMEAVDGLFIGPYDLSADLGAAGDFTTTAFKDALTVTREACRAAGKAPGIHQVATDLNELRARIGEGYRFVAYGTDLIAMRHAFAGVENIG